MTTKYKIQSMILTGLFAALIAVGAFIRVPVPYVPFTLQTMFVVMAGILLGSKGGAMSSLVYLLVGLSGVPIFTQGGGISYVLQPSFGYIVAFILGGWLAGFIVEKFNKRYGVVSLVQYLFASFTALFIIYILGGAYAVFIITNVMGKNLTVPYIINSMFLLLLPGNGISLVLGAIITKKLHNAKAK